MENKMRALQQKDAVYIYLIGFAMLLLGSIVLQILIPEKENLYIYFCYLIPQLGYIGGTFIYAKHFKVSLNFNIKENFVRNKYKYPLALLCGAGLFFSALLLNFLLQIVYKKFSIEAIVTVPALNTPMDYVYCLITICLIPPIAEELVFRKCLGDGFEDIGYIRASFLCGLIFALSHLNVAQTVYQFLLGSLLTFIYLKTKDIFITIIIHTVNNLLAFFLSALTSEALWTKTSVLLICFCAGIIISALSLFFILKNTGKYKEKNKKLGLHGIIMTVCLIIIWLAFAFI